jgi:hypothetical protein
MVVGVLMLAGCTAAPPTPTPDAPCFAGTWQAEDGAFADFIDAVLTSPSISSPLSADAEGEVFLTFTPAGRYSYRPSATFTIQWPNQTQEGSLAGESTGTWTENDGTLLTQADEPDYPGVSFRLAITDGDLQDAPGHVLAGVPILSTDVECDGDRLTATFGAGDIVMPLPFVRVT